MAFKAGQRWFSEAEPELGLGTITNVEAKLVTVFYEASELQRQYLSKNAPLRRYIIENEAIGYTKNGVEFTVKEKEERNGLYFYLTTENDIVCEIDLKNEIELTGPLDRYFARHPSTLKQYLLRYKTLLNIRKYQTLKPKGFLSSKVDLLHHQVSILDKLSNKQFIRCMLCDEVGLGKTIEAALLLKQLQLEGRISSALILVPENLVNQWVIELMTKFNLHMPPISHNDSLDINTNIDETSYAIVSMSKFNQDEEFKQKLMQRDWELIIMDEAHQVVHDESSKLYSDLKSIAHRSQHLILLTATPELLGPKKQFLQLQLISPEKYHDFDDYQKEHDSFKELLPKINEFCSRSDFNKNMLYDFFDKGMVDSLQTKEEAVSALINSYGIGKYYFRNTRENLLSQGMNYPKRLLKTYEIDDEGPKTFSQKIIDIHKNNNGKILVLINDESVLLKLKNELLNQHNLQVAYFHSQQSLVERERQVVFFASDEGASVCLCSDIGSEGRNFAFSEHLIFIDLPLLPDRLEQRIGRLDRIGQKNDIHIHVIYKKESQTHFLLEWYKRVLDSFNIAPKGATIFYTKYRQFIKEHIEALNFNDFEEKLDLMAREYREFKNGLSQSQNFLVDLNSFNLEQSKKSIQVLNDYSHDSPVKDYIEEMCDTLFINIEDHTETVFHMAPSENMLIDKLPGLSEVGKTFTINREESIKRPDYDLISFEHPILQEVLDYFKTTSEGNLALCQSGSIADPLIIEFILNLEVNGSANDAFHHYLPLTPLRVALDSSKKDVTKKYPKNKVDSTVIEATHEIKENLLNFPKDAMKELYQAAYKASELKANSYKEKALLTFTHEMKLKKEGLLMLGKNLKESTLEDLEKYTQHGIQALKNASLNLDSIRIIYKSN
jgi:ATP-dependent helicase HepA